MTGGTNREDDYAMGEAATRDIVAGSAFAERLRVEMARRQMTQQDLASRLGYTQTAMSYWVNGKRGPSLGDLVRLADIFDVTTDYLLGRDGRLSVSRMERFAICSECGVRWRAGHYCGGTPAPVETSAAVWMRSTDS